MMRLTTDQIMADRARMEKVICERIPDGGTRVDLGNVAWADLTPFWDESFGWSLLLETNEPEWVDLCEVYEHFRRKEMTSREWWAELEGEMARSKVCSLEGEVAVIDQRLNHIRQTTLELEPQVRTDSVPLLLSVLPDLTLIAKSLERIADVVDPPPPDKVDTAYVAKKLGIGLARVSQMASQGEIPPSCIVAGTGNGKVWKFHRVRIDQWIESR